MPILHAITKRTIDIVVAVAALPAAAALAGITAILIRLETPGNPLFRQTRVGKGGRPFVIYKLRTMVAGAETIGAGIYNEPGDPRFTRVGSIARKTSIDELPQLLNVLKGDMSIVGPRPMLPVTILEYADDYAEILRVKPGITGLVQVSGRNSLPRRARLELDKQYARTGGLLLDARILLRTVLVVITGRGQMNTQSRADVER